LTDLDLPQYRFLFAPGCLVPALLAECDEKWMTGKIYLTMKT
jgi:hypothetical protein